MPTGTAGDPDVVFQPQLNSFANEYFEPNASCSAVRFVAPTNGKPTVHSHYARSELRQMQGASKANWSTSVGTNEMRWTEAIIELPKGKQEVIAGQIHDSQTDVVTIKLDGTRLFVDHGTSDGATLDDDYHLGTRFTVEFLVSKNLIKTYFNDRLADEYPKEDAGLYFKVGAYVQSNCATEAKYHATCGNSDEAEVDLYEVTVRHS